MLDKLFKKKMASGFCRGGSRTDQTTLSCFIMFLANSKHFVEKCERFITSGGLCGPMRPCRSTIVQIGGPSSDLLLWFQLPGEGSASPPAAYQT